MIPAVLQNTEVLLLTIPFEVLLYIKNQENIYWEVDSASGKLSSQTAQAKPQTYKW